MKDKLNTPLGKTYRVTSELKNITVNTDSTEISIEGWANLSFAEDGTMLPDSDGDVVLSAGINLDRFNTNPVMLWSHDSRSIPVGTFTDVSKKAQGLWVKGTIYKALDPTVFEAVKLGVLKTFSIGFRGINGKWMEDTDIFMFTEIELHEISIVSIPAASGSVFGLTKAMCTGDYCLSVKNTSTNKLDIKEKEENVDEVLKKLTELSTRIDELTDKTVTDPIDEVTDAIDEVIDPIDEVTEKTVGDLFKEISNVEITADNFEEVYGEVVKLQTSLNEFLNKEMEI